VGDILVSDGLAQSYHCGQTSYPPRELAFGSPMKQAYYASTIASFRKDQPPTVLGHLAEQHAHDLDPSSARYDAAAVDQVTDYALDLKNFHAGSHTRRLVPILVATKSHNVHLDLEWSADGVAKPLLSNENNLGGAIHTVIAKTSKQDAFDPEQWSASGYKPTPTIIEAAQALYQGHRVEEITRSDAGAKNLSETTDCLEKIIEEAKAQRHKAICFVTGVPGAGKTLVGLNLVTHRTTAHEEEHAVFLSGNGPLVDVLRETLARDEQERAKEVGQIITKANAARKVKSFIQNIHHFRDAHLQNDQAPVERVAALTRLGEETYM